MASSSTSAVPPSSSPKSIPPHTAKSTTDPILLNTLRYTISAKEYETLHKYIISRSKVLRRNAPSVAKVEKLVERQGKDDYNAAAIRASLRLFLTTSAGLKAWAVIKERFLSGERQVKGPFWRAQSIRLPLSLSAILLFHRILFRFFTRLRAHLLAPEARPFRQRNKRTTQTLTSSLAPAIGASLAGFMLAVYPADQLRTTIAIYALSRAAEFGYNLAEDEGWIWGAKGSGWERPWWWGAWLLFPFTSGQLLHAFVFDRDTFPKSYGDFILKNSPEYIQQKPEGYPSNLPWPSRYTIVDNLAEIARLKYPPFISPILFPITQTLPPSLQSLSPITSAAHPLLTSLTCATLHPHDPSCTRTYLTYYLRAFPPLTRFFTIVFAVLSLPSYRKFYMTPLSSLNGLASQILRYTAFTAGAIGTSWASICLFQALLPRHILATQRFFLSGMLGGLWGFVVRKQAKAEFMFSVRATLDSMWKVGRKRGWWKGVRGGDVWVFVCSLMVVNLVYERDAAGRSIKGKLIRRGLGVLRGDMGEGGRLEGTKEVVVVEGKGKEKEKDAEAIEEQGKVV